MFKIIICEENTPFREVLQQTISLYTFIENWHAEITLSARTPEEVIHHAEKNGFAHLYFFGLHYHGKYKGLTMGRTLREVGCHSDMVVLTNYPHLVHLAFAHKIAPFDYIIKQDISLIRERIIECLCASYAKFSRQEKKRLLCKAEDKDLYIDYESILFFQTSREQKRILLHTKDDEHLIHTTLAKVLQTNKAFFRCHQSVVVNTENILTIDKERKQLHLHEGKSCPVSRRGMQELLKKLHT